MPTLGRKPKTAAGIAILCFIALMILLPGRPAHSQSLSMQLPPPPSMTPVEPNTVTPEPPTDVPPTDIPPTDIPPTDIPPTDIPPTAIPPTDIPPTDIPPTDIPPTGVPPTDAPPTATRMPPSGTPVPSRTVQPTSHPSNPNPACQSSIQGHVLNLAGQRVVGATVRISATGFANQTLTDDVGRYGFSGLCSSSYTLQATLPGGQTTPAQSVSVDGRNTYALDLRLASAATSTVRPTGTIQAPTTSEPSMPVTGFSGWLLVGGLALGLVFVLTAGAQRAMRSRRQ